MNGTSRRALAMQIAVVLGLAAFFCGPVHAAALWGPKSGFEPLGDPAPNIQPYDKEFRWSSEMGGLGVQFDATFIDFFDQAGVNRVTQALKFWDNGASGAGRDLVPGLPANKYDLESVAAHEIGHALGLYHPDKAHDPLAPMNPLRNYQPTPGGVFPFLNNVSGAAAGNEIMLSTIGRGVTRRDLTGDEEAGLNYLYDPANLNPKVGPEVAAMVPGAGIGGLALTALIGQDDDIITDDAIFGADDGKNIDIFAVDFNVFVFPAVPDLGSGATEEIEIFEGANGDTLAVTVVRFSYLPGGDGPGIIDGTPRGVGDMNGDVFFAGVDIYFNTAIMLPPADGPGSGWYVPEPASGVLLLVSAACMGGRRTRKCRRDGAA